MNLIAKSEGLTARQAFQITQSGNLDKLKDSEGKQFSIVDYLLYEDEDRQNGDTRKFLAFVTGDGEMIATNSPTAIRTFEAMIGTFPLPIEDVTIVSGRSKNGRTYYNLALL